jgi:hypothetical protein
VVTRTGTLPIVITDQTTAYRLVNSKFPPISLFEDVADVEEFEVLYQIQALTNPRLLTAMGDLSLVTRDEIPLGIDGCSYAVAPFTHVNPAGSRFSDGSFGVLYLADELATALEEVRYHQDRFWRRVHGLQYDRLVFRGLCCTFECQAWDATVLGFSDPIHDPDDYGPARELGRTLRKKKETAIQYYSVRNPSAICWGLFSPRPVQRVVQSTHYEMIWTGDMIGSINRLHPVAGSC